MKKFEVGTLVIAVVLILGVSGSSVEQEELRARCKAGKEPFACIKYRALQAIDTLNTQSTYQLTESVTLVKNEEVKPTESSGDELEDALETLVESHDVKVDLPEMVGGGSLTLSPRELDDGKVTIKFEDTKDNLVEPKRRKNKLKKLIVPLVVFVLLKAMTLIPLALGVLGLKAWNALQLSFFSFVTSLALAIFQLCKKVAGESAPMPVAAHAAWEPHYYAARNLLVGPEPEVDPSQIAYSAYAQ